MNRERVIKILNSFITHILWYHDKEGGRTEDVEIIFASRFNELADRIIAEEGKEDNKKIYFGCNDCPSPEDYKMKGKYGYIGDRKDAPYVEDLIKQPQQPKLPEKEELLKIIGGWYVLHLGNTGRTKHNAEVLANEIIDYLKAREEK